MLLDDTTTVATLIKNAYVNAGLIDPLQELTGNQYRDGAIRLINLIRHIEASMEVSVFAVKEISFPLEDGKALYTIGQGSGRDVPVVDKLYMLKHAVVVEDNSATGWVPLRESSWSDYYSRPRTDRGQVLEFFQERRVDEIALRFYPEPHYVREAIFTGLFYYSIPFSTSLAANINFPPHWVQALEWQLAALLVVTQPQEIVRNVTMRAQMFLAETVATDREYAPMTFVLGNEMHNAI